MAPEAASATRGTLRRHEQFLTLSGGALIIHSTRVVPGSLQPAGGVCGEGWFSSLTSFCGSVSVRACLLGASCHRDCWMLVPFGNGLTLKPVESQGERTPRVLPHKHLDPDPPFLTQEAAKIQAGDGPTLKALQPSKVR